MEAIHNAVEKTKELFTGESHVINKDIAKAAQHQEELHHKKVKEDLKQDKKIAEAEEKVEKELHKQRMHQLEMNKDLAKASDKVEHEQCKKLNKELKYDAKINRAAGNVMHLQGKQMQQNCGPAVIMTETTTTGPILLRNDPYVH